MSQQLFILWKSISLQYHFWNFLRSRVEVLVLSNFKNKNLVLIIVTESLWHLNFGFLQVFSNLTKIYLQLNLIFCVVRISTIKWSSERIISQKWRVSPNISYVNMRLLGSDWHQNNHIFANFNNHCTKNEVFHEGFLQ